MFTCVYLSLSVYVLWFSYHNVGSDLQRVVQQSNLSVMIVVSIYGCDEGRKYFFYLTTHSTHYLRLYGVRHMVKDHSDSERRNPLSPHGLLFPISSKGLYSEKGA